MAYKQFLLLLTFGILFFNPEACGQRFSLLTEAGYVRSQIDGDKIQGFHYNGFSVALGSNYALNQSNFLSIKSIFSKQGSRRKDIYQPIPRGKFQLEVDLNSIGIELSYKFSPQNSRYFFGGGIVRHQMIGLEYDVIDNNLDPEDRFILEADRLRSAYNSAKFFYGINLFPRAGFYLSFESAFTDIVKVESEELRSLTPYAISAVFTYEIIASKVDTKKSRPGTKTRTRTKAKKRR